MTVFRTSIPYSSSTFTIDHHMPCLTIGSCFAQHIGQRLTDIKFDTLVNPFGILYNPWSIQQALRLLLKQDEWDDKQLVQQDDIWYSYLHHSQFSNLDKQALEKHILESLAKARTFLRTTKVLLLTLGTAYTYFRKDTQQPVANCHKVPASYFDRRLLSIDDCISLLAPTFLELSKQLPGLQIILSVSPVRHLRDGLVDNQRSKAHLIATAHQLSDAMDFINYFPAYELMIDDLRDYRFYKRDMLHPSDTAVDYIWKYFSKSFFSEATQDLIKAIMKIRQASQHRPFQRMSKGHQQFVAQQLQRIAQLEKKYPFLNFDTEKTRFLKDN